MIEPFAILEIGAPRAALTARGGVIGICRLPGRGEMLEADLALIAEWVPAIVVSMTEPTEMAEFGAGAFGTRLEAFGITHAAFPLRDFGAPEATDPRWPPLAGRLHAALDAGSRVLLHCLGGRGRSGMVALRLMIERGCAPHAALAALRAVRPGAVETEAQLRWATLGQNIA